MGHCEGIRTLSNARAYLFPRMGERPIEDETPPYPNIIGSGTINFEGDGTISIEEVLGKPKENAMLSNVKVIARPVVGLIATSLAIGEYARITDVNGSNLGDIVLQTRNGLVNITNPNCIWPTFASPLVERLNTGDKLEITVGFTTDFEQRITRIARDNKIAGIKAVREATNWKLLEAKNYVDGLLAS